MALKDSGPREYTTTAYLDYQQKYADNIKESDKIYLKLIRRLLFEGGIAHDGRMLDIGCSSGNLLYHVRQAFPQLQLTGAEVFPEILDYCRKSERLAGMDFQTMDVRALPTDQTFDIITAAAVMFRFEPAEYEACCAGIAKMLAPGGAFIALDYHHHFDRDLSIFETSKLHPEGITLHMRSFDMTRDALIRAGFDRVEFHPFEIPIDLPMPEDPADVSSYTRKDEDGSRMTFRGVMYQPWCHVVARKA